MSSARSKIVHLPESRSDDGPIGKYYSDEFIGNIAAELNLNKQEAIVLWTGLENAALRWHQNRDNPQIDPRDFDKELNKLARASNQIAETIRSMPDEVWELLKGNWDACGEFHYPPHISFSWNPFLKLDELTITSDGRPDWGDRVVSIDAGDLISLMTGLEWLANQPGYLCRRKKGPQPNMLLRNWLPEIAVLWRNELGRQFVRGHHINGENCSDAYILCVSAYDVLDSDTPASRIENEMKKLIKFSRGGFY